MLAQVLGFYYLCVKPRWSSWLLALARLSPCWGGHLGSEPGNGISLSPYHSFKYRTKSLRNEMKYNPTTLVSSYQLDSVFTTQQVDHYLQVLGQVTCWTNEQSFKRPAADFLGRNLGDTALWALVTT